MTLNLAPMVDVMMCLIIFFLLASRLVGAQSRDVRLAHADAAHEMDRAGIASRIVISVAPTDDPLRADYLVNVWDGQAVSERSLDVDALPEFFRARAEQSRARSDEPRCVIRADRDVAYGHVEAVLRACGAAKIAHVSFGANRDEEAPR